ncbi:HNH endonuclease signature motif containing protein [Myceligenerans halotolerans]
MPDDVEWVSGTDEIGGQFDTGEFGDPECDDVEVVDASGLPVLPPDHTEQELAAILATDPLNDPEMEDAAAEYVSRGPDGRPGVVVDLSRLRLEDLGSRVPGVVLAGVLEGLTGLEPSFDALTADTGAHHGTEVGAQALQALADGELRRVVAGWERVASWARAAQARVAAELMARADGPLGRDSAGGEIAAELHVTTPEGWLIALRGEGTSLYPDLGEALAAGGVDAKKADTFLRAGAELSIEERGAAITDLLPGARTRTWRWVREQMNARAAEVHGRKARRREITDRCNVWAEQAGPGMGRITADLPVVDTARTFNAVQAAAKALKDTPGETRPLGALRAAALTALITGDLVLPCPDDEAEEPMSDAEPPHTDGTTSTATAPGAATAPGVSAGPGAGGFGGDGAAPVHARLADQEPPRLVEPVLDTDLIPVPDDPHGIVLTGPVGGLGTGCSVSNAGASGATGNSATGKSASSDGRMSGAVAGTRVRVIDVTASVNVTVPAGMLLDPEDTTPGILDGIGPIPADVAARIATDATWRRLLTDPVSGILTDYSTRTYTPGATLRAAITARDETCRFPGCHRPATTGGRTAVDLDHIEPFDPERHYRPGELGQTRADNLHTLCRKHHNLKTHANWHVARDPETGTTHWTPPTGTTTVVEPAIVDPTIRYALAQGMTLAKPREAPEPPEPPSTPGAGPSASSPPPF